MLKQNFIGNMRILAAILLNLIIFFALAGQAFADNKLPYVIRNVIVNENGKDSATARKLAIEAGQIKAFKMLLKKISKDPSAHNLEISKDDLLFLVESFEINKEQIFKNSYRATMKVAFNRDNIKDFLTEKLVKISSQKISNILIVPILEQDGQLNIAENTSFNRSKDADSWSNNEWFKAFEDMLASGNNSEFILPIGDLSDLSLLKNVEPFLSKQSKFAPLMAEYDASSVVFVKLAKMQDESGKEKLNVKIRFIKNWRQDYEKNYQISDNDEIEKIYQQIVFELIEKYVTDVSAKMKSKVHSVSFKFAYENLREWEMFRKKLLMLKNIKNLQTQKFHANFVRFKIDFIGSLETLQEVLSSVGLTIERELFAKEPYDIVKIGGGDQ